MAPALFILFWADIKAAKLGGTSNLPICFTETVAHSSPQPPALSVASSAHERTSEEKEHAARSSLSLALYYWRIIDGFGLILVTMAFTLILLPFTLYTTAVGGWRNASLIAMEVVGWVVLAAFFVWELCGASCPLQSRRLLNRTFICCVIINSNYFMVYYIANSESFCHCR